MKLISVGVERPPEARGGWIIAHLSYHCDACLTLMIIERHVERDYRLGVTAYVRKADELICACALKQAKRKRKAAKP